MFLFTLSTKGKRDVKTFEPCNSRYLRLFPTICDDENYFKLHYVDDEITLPCYEIGKIDTKTSYIISCSRVFEDVNGSIFGSFNLGNNSFTTKRLIVIQMKSNTVAFHSSSYSRDIHDLSKHGDQKHTRKSLFLNKRPNKITRRHSFGK